MKASEDFWDDLLGHLKSGTLLPVIGAELVTVKDGDRRVPLYRLLGERLAERYDLPGTYAAICFVILVSICVFILMERLERWLRPVD